MNIITRIKKKLGFDVPVLFRNKTEIDNADQPPHETGKQLRQFQE
jgi:hypothetical protein